MRVLIVEDDQAIAEMYHMKAELSGIAAKRAMNGMEALAVLEGFTPDIVLLDLQMPEMKGAEFLTKFRARPQFATTPVLILTNTGVEEAPKSIWEDGISGFVVKENCTPSEVINKIKDTIEKNAPPLPIGAQE
jgi:DNA-binding response OmpR family regulator